MNECPYIAGNKCDIAKCEEFHISRKEKIELLDRVEKVVKNRINSYNPSYFDIYNVITELSEVVLNGIEAMKEGVNK